MKILHLSDVHWCDEHEDEVQRCVEYVVGVAHAARTGPGPIDLIVISGDLFDRKLAQNSPALYACMASLADLARAAPVAILQGTLSHDVPGAIDPLPMLSDRIATFDGIGVFDFYAHSGAWQVADTGDVCVAALRMGVLPAVNKAELAAGDREPGEYIAEVLRGWAPLMSEARAAGVPTIVVGHGTVSGALTEHGVPMMGLDHEFGLGALFAAEASAVLLGHIHKHQVWTHHMAPRRHIAYAGSLGRLHFGEYGDKGALLWDVDADGATIEIVKTPACDLVDLEFAGAPDLEEITDLAKAFPPGARIRVRWSVDEEHRGSVDQDAIRAALGKWETKLEGRVIPIVRRRSEESATAVTVLDRIRAWATVADTEPGPLVERLEELITADDSQILRRILA